MCSSLNSYAKCLYGSHVSYCSDIKVLTFHICPTEEMGDKYMSGGQHVVQVLGKYILWPLLLCSGPHAIPTYKSSLPAFKCDSFKRKSPKSTVMLLLASFSPLIQLFHRSVITHLHRQLAPTFLPPETIPASQFFLSTTPFQPTVVDFLVFECESNSYWYQDSLHLPEYPTHSHDGGETASRDSFVQKTTRRSPRFLGCVVAMYPNCPLGTMYPTLSNTAS